MHLRMHDPIRITGFIEVKILPIITTVMILALIRWKSVL